MNNTMETRQPFLYLAGIVGYPLGHSLSPLLHNWAAALLGLHRVYLSWEKPPEDLPRFMDALRALPIHGLSVTIPHKERIIDFADYATDRALAIGAANTLYWREGELWAENTDVDGFLAPLQGRRFTSALVLGSGGAARAVLSGLKETGVPNIYLSNRAHERAVELAAKFQVLAVSWEERADVNAELVVNTTPVGMAGSSLEQMSPYPAEALKEEQTAYDLVYNPLETVFLRQARLAGLKVIEGLEMFIGQAAKQHSLWTPEGPEMPMTQARQLLRRALSQRTP